MSGRVIRRTPPTAARLRFAKPGDGASGGLGAGLSGGPTALHRVRTGAVCAALPLLAACAGLQPRNTPPPLPLAAQVQPLTEGVLTPDAAEAPAPTEADLHWWRRFADPQLDRWVERALAGDPQIEIARLRIDEARAALRAAQGARSPQVSAIAGLDLQRPDGLAGRGAEPRASLALNWDADLWGGLAAGERVAAATLAARRDEAQAVRLSTAALTVRAYIAWQEAQVDRAAQQRTLDLLRETARVVRVRVDVGLAPQLDGLRAEGERAAAESALVAAQARVREAQRALQILTGARPGRPHATEDRPAAGRPLAPALMDVPLGLPVVLPLDLLRLRPDLRAAEQAVRAAEARRDQAAAARRPSLRLPGVLTLGTAGGGEWLAQLAARLAVEWALPLADGDQRAAEQDAARAQVALAQVQYRRTVLLALAQAAAAYASHADALQALEAQRAAVQAAEAAESQARTLYDNGLTGFLDLLEAQRSSLARRQALVRLQADGLRAAVAVYESLGLVPVAAPEAEGPRGG